MLWNNPIGENPEETAVFRQLCSQAKNGPICSLEQEEFPSV